MTDKLWHLNTTDFQTLCGIDAEPDVINSNHADQWLECENDATCPACKEIIPIWILTQ